MRILCSCWNIFYRHEVLLIFMISSIMCLADFVGTDETPVDGICPTPMPCHCLSDSVIYCAFKQLETLPYFLEFEHDWDEMDLSENILRNLPDSGFKGVRVRRLNLARNSITKIEPGAFLGLKGIKAIDLSHNYLKGLSRDILSPLRRLKHLRIRYNQLTSIDNDAFVDITQLSELDLTGNELVAVPSEAICKINGLKRLILRNNKLQKVGPHAFHNLPLEYLDLGSNTSPLTLHEDAFCGLEPRILHTEPGVTDWAGLTTLLLDHNGLTTLNPCLTHFIWTLSNLDLSGNPLKCDCSLLSLRDSGAKPGFPGAQCASPEKFAGQYFEQVDQSALYACVRHTNRDPCGDYECGAPAPYSSNSSESIVLSWIIIRIVTLLPFLLAIS